MALIARGARARFDVARVFSLPRPGRWAGTLTLGFAVFAGVEFLTGFSGVTAALAFVLGVALVANADVPGRFSRALYGVTIPAPFRRTRNQVTLRAAMDRRHLAALLTEYWYGESRVARDHGQAPGSRYVARAFLAGLAARLEEAGLPTGSIDPRQPRAIDNVRETEPGVYTVVNLESGVVSPVASLTTWGRALRRGRTPFSSEVFFDVTRAYVAREEERMRAKLGDAWVANLYAVLDDAEAAPIASRSGERRTVTPVSHMPAPPMPLRRPIPLDPSGSSLPQAA